MPDKLKVFNNTKVLSKKEGDVVTVYTVPTGSTINIKNLVMQVNSKHRFSKPTIDILLDDIIIDSSEVLPNTITALKNDFDIIAEENSVISLGISERIPTYIKDRPLVFLNLNDVYIGKIPATSTDETASDTYDSVIYQSGSVNLYSTTYTPDFACMVMYNGSWYSFHLYSNIVTGFIIDDNYDVSSLSDFSRASVFPTTPTGLTTDGTYLYSKQGTNIYKVAISDIVENTYSGNVETLVIDTSIGDPTFATGLFEYYNGKIYSLSNYASSTATLNTIYEIDLDTLTVKSILEEYANTNIIAYDAYYQNPILSVTKDGTPYMVVILGASASISNLHKVNLRTGEYSFIDISSAIGTNSTSIRRTVDLGYGYITFTAFANTTTEATMVGAVYDLNTDTLTDKTTWLGGNQNLSYTTNTVGDTMIVAPQWWLSGEDLDIDISIYASGVESTEV